MKKHLLILSLLAASLLHLTAQTTITLTFTAQVNGNHQPLDSVQIENITQGGDTTLYGTDTVLVLDHGIGINNRFENPGNQMILHPAYPNPVTQTSTIRLWLPQHGPVTIRLYDIVGRGLTTFSQSLGAGEHTFTFSPGKETFYLLVAEAPDQRMVQKLISLNPEEGSCRISYVGHQPAQSRMRKGRSTLPWVPGDDLRYIGFAGTGIEIKHDKPFVSTLYTFQFPQMSYPVGTVHCDSVNPTVIIDVINPVTGKIWMDRNLGARQAATSSTDSLAYGDLYQWGRFADGHQCRTSDTTYTMSSSDLPGHGDFILAPNLPSDWRNPQNNNLWQGINGVNNPCPTGYRLPTDSELQAERLSWSSNNAMGAFTSPLKLTMAGSRLGSDGMILAIGTSGGYWASSCGVTNSRNLNFTNSNAMNHNYLRAGGLSIRCIKN